MNVQMKNLIFIKKVVYSLFFSFLTTCFHCLYLYGQDNRNFGTRKAIHRHKETHPAKERTWIRILLFLLLCLVSPGAKSQVLFENKSLDACYVLAIVNIDLTTDLQKKYEEKYIATSVIIGYSLSNNEVKLYWLDDRYDFDLYSIQKGDSITLYYPHTSRENKKKAIAINNHSFQERITKNDSIYIDIDFFDIEKKLSLPPSLDDGLFLRWEIAKQRFIGHIIKDSQGLHRLDVESEDDLRLSKRIFGQLYCMYILAHNETIRNKK
mgnify:CR=1 FL=1